MAKQKQLTKRQLAVIEDLFSGELGEQQVLDKHNVSRNVYNKWQAEDNFSREFAQRIAGAHRQGQLIIARCASLAAAKLVQLTESENQETARKACLDIISLPKSTADKADRPSGPEMLGQQQNQQLSPETASRLLTALAKTEREQPPRNKN